MVHRPLNVKFSIYHPSDAGHTYCIYFTYRPLCRAFLYNTPDFLSVVG